MAEELVASLIKGYSPQQLAQMQNDNHDAEFYTVATVFSLLSTCAVALRVASRHMKNSVVGVDDALVICAWAIALAQTIWICIGTRDYGLGHHLWTLTPDQFVKFNKLWFSVGVFQCTALMMTKVSVLILYYRIFVKPGFRLAAKALGVITLLWWLGTVLSDILICLPPAYNWNPSIPAQCGNKRLVWIIPPIPWILTDLACVLLPLPVIWHLHMPRLQRAGLVGLFLLGGFATVSSCVRYGMLFILYDQKDLTYAIGPGTTWTIIESHVTIVSASLLLSKPWLLKIYPRRLVSFLRERVSTGSSRRHSSRKGQSKRNLLSTFRRAGSTPPAITRMSMGPSFEKDVEKHMSFETERTSV